MKCIRGRGRKGMGKNNKGIIRANPGKEIQGKWIRNYRWQESERQREREGVRG